MFIFKLIRYAMEMQLIVLLSIYCKLFNIDKTSKQIGLLETYNFVWNTEANSGLRVLTKLLKLCTCLICKI